MSTIDAPTLSDYRPGETIWSAETIDDERGKGGKAVRCEWPRGAGNTREGQAIIDAARRAAYRQLRQHVPGKGRRTYVILENRESSGGALTMLLIAVRP